MHAPVRVERATFFERLIREPLVHFLLIGLMLFAVYAAIGRSTDNRDIRIDDNVIASLNAQFQNTWQRTPTASEMNALVDSYVREQIFYREGMALGLDRDDPTITRRVSQKFTTIAEESDGARPPNSADLESWLHQHANRYADPLLVSFDQITFEPLQSVPGTSALEAAREALAQGADPRTFGNGHTLLPHYELYPFDLVQKDFGLNFARGLLKVRPGAWEGPVSSGYGLHLVKVEKVLPGRLPKLDEVRTAVARDYEEDRRRKSVDAAYGKLRQSYRIEYSGRWKPA